jgi:hypothetical protein
MRKPTPKVASDNNSDAIADCAGKKFFAITTAKKL